MTADDDLLFLLFILPEDLRHSHWLCLEQYTIIPVMLFLKYAYNCDMQMSCMHEIHLPKDIQPQHTSWNTFSHNVMHSI